MILAGRFRAHYVRCGMVVHVAVKGEGNKGGI